MKKNNSGTTLIETMLAIFIFSILSAVISVFLVSSVRNFRKMQKVISRENSIILLEKTLSGQFARIRLPFWAVSEKIESEDGSGGPSIVIPWYDGIIDNTLSVSGTQNGISVSNPDNSAIFKNLKLDAIEHVYDETQNYVRLEVSSGQEKREMIFLFSGFGTPGE